MAISRLFVEIGKDVDRLNQSLRESMRAAEEAGVKVTSTGQRMLSSFERALNPTKELGEQIQLLEKAGKSSADIWAVYENRIKEAAEAQQKMGTAIDPTVQRLLDQNVQVERNAINWKNLSTQLTSVGNHMSSIGRSMSMGITVPITAAAAAVFKFGSDFETAFAGVEKTVDATREELDRLSVGIREMSTEIPVAAREIAGIAAAAGQLGIKTENILGFSRVMADLGVATNMAAEEAATSLARLANVTQMPQQSFDRLGSTIVELGNNLATTESEIVAMSLRLAGAGTQIGMSEAQILSFAAALSSVGIEAEAGGSAMSKLFIQIASDVATMGGNLSTFARVSGMTAEQFRQAFQEDAAGAITAFISGLGRINESGGNTLAILAELGITEVRMRDAMLRTSGAGDLLTKSLTLGAEAWKENNALTKEADKFYSTTANQLKMLANRLMDAGLTIYQALKPAIDAAIRLFEDFAEKVKVAADLFAELPTSMQTTIVAITGLAAAAGPTLIVLGSLTKAVATMATVIPAASAAINGSAGLTMAVRSLGAAGAATAAVFAGWQIAEWIDKLDLFGRRAAVAENEIIKQAAAYRKQAIDIGAVREAMAKYQELFDKGAITEGTMRNIFADLTDQRPTETLEQYRDRMKEMVEQYEAAHEKAAETHQEIAHGGGVIEQYRNSLEALKTTFNGFLENDVTRALGIQGPPSLPARPDVTIARNRTAVDESFSAELERASAEMQKLALEADDYWSYLRNMGAQVVADTAMDVQQLTEMIGEEGRRAIDIYLEQAREALAEGTGGFNEIAATALGGYLSDYENVLTGVADSFGNFFDYLADGFARAIAFSDDFGEALEDIGRNAVGVLIASLVRLGIQWALNKAIMSSADKGVLAANAAQAAATATAWAPAAALVSLATLGANAAPANIAIGTTSAVSMGVAAMSRLGGFQEGGFTGWGSPDQVAGFVHGQEFVMDADVTRKYRPLLEALNAGHVPEERSIDRNGAFDLGALASPQIQVSIQNYGTSKAFDVQLDEGTVRIIARDEALSVLTQRGPEVIAADLAYANSRTSKALAKHTTARRGDR